MKLFKLLSLFLWFLGVSAHAQTPFSITCLERPHYGNSCEELEAGALRAYQFVTNRIPDPIDRIQSPIKIEVKTLSVVARTVIRNHEELIQVSSSLHSLAAFQIGLVHELTHLIRHAYQPEEELWLDEALAEFMGILFSNGYPIAHEEKIRSSGQILISNDSSDYEPGKAGYANAYYLMLYLYGHLGGEAFLKALGTSEKIGWEVVATAAVQMNHENTIGIPETYLTAKSLFTHYAFSLLLNDSFAARYNLMGLNPNLSPLLNSSLTLDSVSLNKAMSAFVIKPQAVGKLSNSRCTIYNIKKAETLEISVYKKLSVDLKSTLFVVCF